MGKFYYVSIHFKSCAERMNMVEEARSHIETELKGKTLLVYWYFLHQKDKNIGVRAIQRALNFSSPSIASHHLAKLRRFGLIDKNALGEYSLIEEVKVGFLKFFISLGRLMLPRYLFYAVLFSCMFITYLVVYPQSIYNVHNLVALIFGITACTILWYETIKIVRDAPFKKIF